MARKTLLIDKNFQLKMISHVMLMVITALVISGIVAYIFALKMEQKSSAKLYAVTDSFNEDIIMTSKGEVLKPVIIRAIAVSIVLASIVSFLVVLIYSHRLAGPLFRIQKYLEKINRGEKPEKLALRKNDEFSRLADLINKLTGF